MEQGQDPGRAAATTHRHAARLGRGRPRPRTRPRAQAAPPACRPARSAFFGHRIGIADAHHTGLALAHHHAGFAPGAALLPAQAARVQGAPDRERADPGQSVRSLAQGSLQQAQRPSRRAVRLALGRAGPFGQDALLRISAIADPWSAPMAGPHGGEPVAVEATDPGRDGLSVPSSNLVSGGRVTGATSNGQQGAGTLDLRGRALRGERLRSGIPRGHWKATTFVAGLRLTGMMAPFVLDGSMNRPAFLAYVARPLKSRSRW